MLLAPHPVRLEMVCQKCTRSQEFTAPDAEEAARVAIRYGWLIRGDRAVCKRCAK